MLWSRFTSWQDIREGEAKLVVRVAALLFVVIAAHTLLETARDALFLTRLEPNRLALAYGALALTAMLAARLSTLLSQRVGERQALRYSLLAGALITALFFVLPKTPVTVFVFYLWTGVFAAVVVAQFWILAGRVFTIAEAKRLIGSIAAGGVLGGVAGGGTAVLALTYLTTDQLLPIAAALLAAAAMVVAGIRTKPGKRLPSSTEERPSNDAVSRPSNAQRYVRLAAILIATATMTFLCVDYLFKATVARSIDSASLAAFFASYYAVLNLVALGLQLVFSTRVLRRLGVLDSVAVLPMVLLVGGAATLMVGPALLFILLLKGADGSLRHSLHRTSTELLWMPLPREIRAATKPLVDTFVVRTSQAFGAGGIFALGLYELDTPGVLLSIVMSLSATWVLCTVLLKKPYLALFRSTLTDDREVVGPLLLDIDSLELLFEALSSMNDSRAIAALHLLSAHKRPHLIPALVLFHPSEQVLLSALERVPAADRDDWIVPTLRLIGHESEAVRLAAIEALVEYGMGDALEARLQTTDPTLRGRGVFLLVNRQPGVPEEHPSVAAILNASDAPGLHSKSALLQAIRGQPSTRWTNVVVQLLGDADLEVSTDAVHTAAMLVDARLVPALIGRLTVRKQRDAVRDALVSQGQTAFTQVARLLRAGDTDPRLHRHLPRTISRFATQQAADLLLHVLAREPQGVLRYKALRALGRLAQETTLQLNGELLEEQLQSNLREHLKMSSGRYVVASYVGERAVNDSGGYLLLDLLADKARQALERAFRLVQLTHADESIRAGASALLFGDRSQRAQGLEYLSTLALDLQPETRELLRRATDDLEQALRKEFGGGKASMAKAYIETLSELMQDDDDDVRSIVAYHVERLGAPGLRLQLSQVTQPRPRSPA